MEMRKEDVGRTMLQNSSNLDREYIKGVFKEYFESMPLQKFYLLNSKSLNYFTFIKVEEVNCNLIVENFLNLLEDCSFFKTDESTGFLSNIKELEINKSMGYLEMWCDGEFFALMPWGMEVI